MKGIFSSRNSLAKNLEGELDWLLKVPLEAPTGSSGSSRLASGVQAPPPNTASGYFHLKPLRPN